MSRTHPSFLMKLFQMEVPEVYEGIVEIKAVAREPGERAKVAVASNNADVDPVGACVGMKGSRVQAVVQELKGEKIDIVHWAEDSAILVKNALSPAQIARVITDEEEHSMEVIVPDDQLSLAIGKKGQNVRLAAKLTGWKIDIRTESEVKGSGEALNPEESLRREMEAAGEREGKEKAVNAVVAKEIGDYLGVSQEIADALVNSGIDTMDGLKHLNKSSLKGFFLDADMIEAILKTIGEKERRIMIKVERTCVGCRRVADKAVLFEVCRL